MVVTGRQMKKQPPDSNQNTFRDVPCMGVRLRICPVRYNILNVGPEHNTSHKKYLSNYLESVPLSLQGQANTNCEFLRNYNVNQVLQGMA